MNTRLDVDTAHTRVQTQRTHSGLAIFDLFVKEKINTMCSAVIHRWICIGVVFLRATAAASVIYDSQHASHFSASTDDAVANVPSQVIKSKGILFD